MVLVSNSAYPIKEEEIGGSSERRHRRRRLSNRHGRGHDTPCTHMTRLERGQKPPPPRKHARKFLNASKRHTYRKHSTPTTHHARVDDTNRGFCVSRYSARYVSRHREPYIRDWTGATLVVVRKGAGGGYFAFFCRNPGNKVCCLTRLMASLPTSMRRVVAMAYNHADPSGSLMIQTVPLPAMGPNEVLVRVTVRPINPSDVAGLQVRWCDVTSRILLFLNLRAPDREDTPALRRPHSQQVSLKNRILSGSGCTRVCLFGTRVCLFVSPVLLTCAILLHSARTGRRRRGGGCGQRGGPFH